MVDEASFISKGLWMDLILPLNMQDKTSLLAATTPKGAYNSYAGKLMKFKRQDGSLIFNVVKSEELCEKCIAEGNDDICPHRAALRSKNKSTQKIRDTGLLYDDEDRKKEELYGYEVSTRGRIIDQETVDTFRTHVIDFNQHPRCVYVSIDPSGGGSGSQLGIVVAAEYVDPKFGPKLTVCVFITSSVVPPPRLCASPRPSCWLWLLVVAAL